MFVPKKFYELDGKVGPIKPVENAPRSALATGFLLSTSQMDNFVRRTPSMMKSCLKEIWDNWSSDPSRGDNRRIIAWFIMELKRMDYSDGDVWARIDDWMNERSPFLSQSKIESVRALVFKILENPYELGCPSDRPYKAHKSVLSEICFRHDRPCPYYEEFQRINKKLKSFKIDETLYSKYRWTDELMKANPSNGLYADIIYKILRNLELERGIPPGGTIYVGYRKMATIITLKRRGPTPHPMTLCRATRVLETSGLIKIVEHGLPRGGRAISKPRANGYRRVIPIPAPEGRIDPAPLDGVVTHT